VPIVAEDEVVAVLVTGPFAVARPSGKDILERWRGLTGRQGHLADPQFAAYLPMTLSTLVLEGSRAKTFERLVVLLARLLAGAGSAGEIMNELDALRVELEPARFVERQWEAVRTMVDDRASQTWASMSHAYELKGLGLSRMPDHVLVAFSASLDHDAEPVDEAVRRHALQRRSVDLAREMGDVVAGRVGDHGVVFLSAARGSDERKRQKLVALAERASAVARRDFGLSLHLGACVTAPSLAPSRSYEAALAAAESALAGGALLKTADVEARAPATPLRQLRRDLALASTDRPELLGARFERYMEAVAAQCGYRIEPARAHFESGFERMADALVASGALDARSFAALCQVLDRSAGEARSMSDLFAAYRRAALDLSEALERPVPARRDRGLRRALDFVHNHFAEPLRLDRVARMAGFAPNYFSQLFKANEKRTFADYLVGLRVERARQLLTGTNADVARVAERSGFRSAQYFSRVFRRRVGVTPREYRKRAGGVGRRQRKTTSSN
jgi:AraC-like DNA-binding protein